MVVTTPLDQQDVIPGSGGTDSSRHSIDDLAKTVNSLSTNSYEPTNHPGK
jgi:hypothetical protein